MKHLLLAALLVAVWSLDGYGQSLPAWVSALPLWEWYEIPNTALSSVEPSHVGMGDPTSKISAWNGATLKRSGSVYMLGAAGGHGNYAGNEVDALTLNTTTPAWVQLHAPSVLADIVNGTQFYLDYRPSDTHTYYATQFVDSLNRMFVIASPGVSGSWPDPPMGWYPYTEGAIRSYSYNLSLNEWDTPDYVDLYPGTGDFTAAMVVKNPLTGDIYSARAGGDTNLYKWTALTNLWSVAGGPIYSGGYAGSAIDPTRNRMLIVGSYSGTDSYHVKDLTATDVSVTIGGLGSGALDAIPRYSAVVYDEVNDTFVILYQPVAEDADVSVLRVSASTWYVDAPTITGTAPGPRPNGIHNAAQYVPELGGIVMTNSYTGNVFFLRTSLTGINVIGATVESFTLTSVADQTLAPFTVGLVFKQGDIPNKPTLDITDQQVVIKRRWNDGSVKQAVASGHVTLDAGTPRTVHVANTSIDPDAPLTASDIETAAPSASFQAGSIGTVNLSSLLASPFRTWISGPEMVEAHYRSAVGSDATLVVWFYVQLYKNGKLFIRVAVENGYVDVTKADKTYVPTVIIDGVTVYNNSGSSITQYSNTGWTVEGWIGGDPEITPTFDTTYLKTTKLVPNYMLVTPSGSVLNALSQTYTPMASLDLSPDMSDTGFQNQIGLFPLWDALFVISGGDSRAYHSVLANAKALSSYAVGWNDSATYVPVIPSDRTDWDVFGQNMGGTTIITRGSLTWDIAHHPSEGYLAYILTGDYYYLKTMEGQAAACYLSNSEAHGLGTSRILSGQTRGAAWCTRTLSQLDALTPDDDEVGADYQEWLSNNIDYWKSVVDSLSGSGIGYFYEYDLMTFYGPGTDAPWQQHFFMQSLGLGSDIDPLSSMTNYDAVRNWLYRGIVGALGTVSTFCFTYASDYNFIISSGTSTDPTTWYTLWSDVFAATHVGISTCSNTLLGTSGSDPLNASTGYWGNLLPAISYAVDHGASGASASYARLTGATNWSDVLNSGFDSIPIFGIIPRDLTPLPSETTLFSRMRFRH